jgi:hypothetical protein
MVALLPQKQFASGASRRVWLMSGVSAAGLLQHFRRCKYPTAVGVPNNTDQVQGRYRPSNYQQT